MSANDFQQVLRTFGRKYQSCQLQCSSSDNSQTFRILFSPPSLGVSLLGVHYLKCTRKMCAILEGIFLLILIHKLLAYFDTWRVIIKVMECLRGNQASRTFQDFFPLIVEREELYRENIFVYSRLWQECKPRFLVWNYFLSEWKGWVQVCVVKFQGNRKEFSVNLATIFIPISLTNDQRFRVHFSAEPQNRTFFFAMHVEKLYSMYSSSLKS